MRIRCLGAIAVIALVGFAPVPPEASKNKGKIEGTKWSSIASKIKGMDLPAGVLKLDFSKDGKLVYEAGPVKFTGTYTLGKGAQVTFVLDRDLGGKGKTHTEKVVIEDDRLTMTDADGTSMVFEKAKEAAHELRTDDGRALCLFRRDRR